MSELRIVAAFVRSATKDTAQLDGQQIRIEGAAQAEGQAIDQVFRDLDELRRAVAGGGISTLWLTSPDRLGRGAKGLQVLEEIMTAGVEVRTPEGEIIPIVLALFKRMAAQNKEDFLRRMERGKQRKAMAANG